MKVNKSVTATYEVVLGAGDIIKLLNDNGNKIPKNASVVFRVPEGGDFAGESVELKYDTNAGKSSVVVVRWTRLEG